MAPWDHLVVWSHPVQLVMVLNADDFCVVTNKYLVFSICELKF